MCVFIETEFFFLLQWIDREGKTPLIVACMNHELFDTAKTLIELGANVNAYRPSMLVKVLTLSNGLLVIMLQMIVAIWLWVIYCKSVILLHNTYKAIHVNLIKH